MKRNVSLYVDADFFSSLSRFSVYTSFSHASRNTLFLIIAIKTSRLFGRTCASSRSIYTIFLPPPVSRHPPAPPSPLVLMSLLNYPSARSCRAKLGCGRRSRDTTPHHGTPEAVKNSSACQAWNFDIERIAGVTAPRRSRQEAGRRGVRDRAAICTNCTHARHAYPSMEAHTCVLYSVAAELMELFRVGNI